jgi:hypothetical protein
LVDAVLSLPSSIKELHEDGAVAKAAIFMRRTIAQEKKSIRAAGGSDGLPEKVRLC